MRANSQLLWALIEPTGNDPPASRIPNPNCYADTGRCWPMVLSERSQVSDCFNAERAGVNHASQSL